MLTYMAIGGITPLVMRVHCILRTCDLQRHNCSASPAPRAATSQRITAGGK